MRQLLGVIIFVTIFAATGELIKKIINKIKHKCLGWTTITFFGESVRIRKDPDNENMTISTQIPRLLIKSYYPWNAMSGMPHMLSLIFQVLINILKYLFWFIYWSFSGVLCFLFDGTCKFIGFIVLFLVDICL